MSDNKSNIDFDKIVNHWTETSNDDFNTMLTLYDSKSYGWSLFLGHISTEKLLKALYVKQHSPHQSNRLITIANERVTSI